MKRGLWLRISWALAVIILTIVTTDIKTYAEKADEVQTNGEELQIPVEEIDFMFEIKDDESLAQTITFVISSETTQEMGEQIEKYMMDKFENAYIPDLVAEMGPDEEGSSYTYIRYRVAINSCDVLFSSLLGKDNVAFNVEDRSEYFSPFTFATQLNLDIDIPDCFVGEEGDIIPCYFGVKETYDYKYFVADSVEEAKSWNSKYTKTDRTGTYDLIYEVDYAGDTIHFPLWILNENKVRYIDVDLGRNEELWSRVSTFTFDRPVNEKTAERIQKNFEEIASGFDVERRETKIQVAGEWEEKDFKLIITQNGDEETLEMSSGLLFGSEEGLEYTRDSSFWKIKKKEFYKGQIDYSRILEKVPANFKITYKVPVGTMGDCNYCNYEDRIIEDGFLKISTREYGVDLDYEGTLIDFRAAALWTAVVVIPLIAAMIVLKVICRKYRMVHGAGKKQAFFCPKCGTLVKSGSTSCPKCKHDITR